MCYQSKSRAIYDNSKNSSCFTTFHPHRLRFSCYTLGKKIKGPWTALKRKNRITGWILKRLFSYGDIGAEEGFYAKSESPSPQAVPAAGEPTISMTALLELLKNADPEVKAQLRLALLT